MNPIKHITIEAKIPEGIPIGDLSRKYPETTLYVTNGHWIKENERILYITSKEWSEEFFEYLKKHSSVIEAEKIGNVIMLHIQSKVLEDIEQKKLTIIYPTTLKNGKHRIEFLISEKQLAPLKKTLPECRVLKISDTYKQKFDLTETQEAIVTKAYSLGYYNYPREVTLTDLAKLLQVSKATLSQTLRSVENKAILALIKGKE